MYLSIRLQNAISKNELYLFLYLVGASTQTKSFKNNIKFQVACLGVTLPWRRVTDFKNVMLIAENKIVEK